MSSFSVHGPVTLPATYVFDTLKIGGGGFVTGGDLLADGTKVVRTDTYGTYLLNTTTGIWQQLVTRSSLPATDNGVDSATVGYGVYDIAVAPTNTNRMYMNFNGYIFASVTRGSAWSRTSFTRDTTANTSDNYRGSGRQMAVDPANELIVYAGTPTGLYKTTDGGTTFSNIATTLAPLGISLGTSTTSIAVGTGAKSFTTNTSFQLGNGTNVQVYETGNTANQMFGTVTSDTGTALVLNITQVYGSGTHADWTFTKCDHGGVLVAFDPTSSVVGNVTQGIYAAVYGLGVYHSTDGGGTWALTSSPPLTCNHMLCDAAGLVWLVDDANGNTSGALNKLASGTWSSVLASSNNAHSVAVDPANGAHVYAGDSGGRLLVSVNTGGSFVGPTTISRATGANQPAWLTNTNETFMSNGNMAFDPAGSNLLYFFEGIGVWTTNPPTTNTNVTWTSKTAGIENLDLNHVVGSVNGGTPLIIGWDRAAFVITPGTYATINGVDVTGIGGVLQSGWSGDVAADNSVMVALATPVSESGVTTGTSGKTLDKGGSWSLFASQTPLSTNSTYGGSMAASTTTNFLWVPKDNSSNANSPWYTTNGGTTWTASVVGGTISTTAPTGWGENYYQDTITVAADRVTAGTFYVYNDGQRNSVDKGIWRTIDGGVTWTQRFAGNFGGGFGGAIQIKSVPGQAGHLFATAGNQGVGNHPAATQLFKCTDGGATWSPLANVSETFCVGFGKAAAGHPYPAICIVGWVNSVYGIWLSVDGDQATPTWTKIGDGYPAGSIDPIKDCDGDSLTFGTFYFVTGGNGSLFVQLR